MQEIDMTIAYAHELNVGKEKREKEQNGMRKSCRELFHFFNHVVHKAKRRMSTSSGKEKAKVQNDMKSIIIF